MKVSKIAVAVTTKGQKLLRFIYETKRKLKKAKRKLKKLRREVGRNQ